MTIVRGGSNEDQLLKLEPVALIIGSNEDQLLKLEPVALIIQC